VRLCPCCKEELVLKRIPAHYGRYLEVDQCPQCGGIWFDKFELIAANPYGVDNLITPKTSENTCSSLGCPVDGTPLEILKDSIIPKDVTIYYCNECNGMWLSAESLKKYKDFQKDRLAKKKEESELPKEVEEKIDQLLASQERASSENFGEVEDKMAEVVSYALILLRILSFLRK